MADIEEGKDTEITLGVGKLLAMFFVLVILCGISLGVGYSIGRNSAKQVALAPQVVTPTPANSSISSSSKPGASGSPSKGSDCAAAENCTSQQAATPNTKDLTFYQSVQQKDEHPQLTPPTPNSPQPEGRTVEVRNASSDSGYLVQIAAVRNKDDAKLLSSTLQKQQYPVIITQPGDSLFHVQVGPYADVKEAEAVRTRLVNAGYNAFLKR